jgi:NAD(P)-dependent dehydrogenase (short-subunit alcohol dehydrogenase family)
MKFKSRFPGQEISTRLAPCEEPQRLLMGLLIMASERRMPVIERKAPQFSCILYNNAAYEPHALWDLLDMWNVHIAINATAACVVIRFLPKLVACN